MRKHLDQLEIFGITIDRMKNNIYFMIYLCDWLYESQFSIIKVSVETE